MTVLEDDGQLFVLYKLIEQLHRNLFHHQKDQIKIASHQFKLVHAVVEHWDNFLVFGAGCQKAPFLFRVQIRLVDYEYLFVVIHSRHLLKVLKRSRLMISAFDRQTPPPL